MAHRWDNVFHNHDGKKRAMTQATPALAAHAIARAQHLVDSRPEGAYQLDWCQEALHFGDLSVLAIALMTQATTTPAQRNPRESR